jgi:hypothetical protein
MLSEVVFIAPDLNIQLLYSSFLGLLWLYFIFICIINFNVVRFFDMFSLLDFIIHLFQLLLKLLFFLVLSIFFVLIFIVWLRG